MNVFVLCTGRCGSKTFAKACGHVTNYTAAHESGRHNKYALEYPQQHIEVDNRLAWFLGLLYQQYPDAFYVHLLRNLEDTARSYASRGAKLPVLIAHAWFGIKQGSTADLGSEALQMVETVNANIRHFLRDKPHMTIHIEAARDLFPAFWEKIEAEGDLPAAMAELDKRYNEGPQLRR